MMPSPVRMRGDPSTIAVMETVWKRDTLKKPCVWKQIYALSFFKVFRICQLEKIINAKKISTNGPKGDHSGATLPWTNCNLHHHCCFLGVVKTISREMALYKGNFSLFSSVYNVFYHSASNERHMASSVGKQVTLLVAKGWYKFSPTSVKSLSATDILLLLPHNVLKAPRNKCTSSPNPNWFPLKLNSKTTTKWTAHIFAELLLSPLGQLESEVITASHKFLLGFWGLPFDHCSIFDTWSSYKQHAKATIS